MGDSPESDLRNPEHTLSNVFVSYARKDDLQEIPGTGQGFVTTLWQHLQLRFELHGPPSPLLFKDTREIWDSDDFEPLLFDGIDKADALLIILSNNWLHRPWCRKELEWFEDAWKSREGSEFKSRLIVVAKQPIDASLLPEPLRHQGGHRFYRLTNQLNKPGAVYPYFWHGEPRLEFHDAVDRLVDDLYARPKGRRAKNDSSQDATQTPIQVQPRSPSVYIAKAAADMDQQYRRVAGGLQSRGYQITPPPESEIPTRNASDFIRQQLESTLASVHLLGEGSGFTPEDGTPAVSLQLQLARSRAIEKHARASQFQRLIWCPRIFSPDGNAHLERDAAVVMARFDQQIEGDKIDDGDVVRFVEFALQHLDRKRLADDVPPPLQEGSQIYVYHRIEDRNYGRRVALALQKLRYRPIVPRSEGDLARQIHESALRDCDGVVIGWESADDAWICATARNWDDWRALGRKRAFSCRALVVGPPSRPAKEDMVDFPPPELDLVVDIRDREDVPPERLAEFLARITARPELDTGA